ncbi:MAG: hypothetical protein AAGF94_17940 [Pseudomonadota bacterium]
MADKYQGQNPGLTSPGIDAVPINPSNTNDLEFVTRALYIGQTGNVRLQMLDGTDVTFTQMQAGGFYPLRVKRVYASGTTAGAIVGVN